MPRAREGMVTTSSPLWMIKDGVEPSSGGDRKEKEIKRNLE